VTTEQMQSFGWLAQTGGLGMAKYEWEPKFCAQCGTGHVLVREIKKEHIYEVACETCKWIGIVMNDCLALPGEVMR
jgi:hypothetical protein